MFFYNGDEYELPKKTMALNDKIEAVRKAKSTKEAYIRMMDFVVSGLGKEKVTKLLGTNDVNRVDLSELNILADAIVMGYDRKVAQPQIERANEIVNNDAFTGIIQVGKSVKELNEVKK